MVAKLRSRLMCGLALTIVAASPLTAQQADPAPAEPAEPANEIIVEGYTETQVREFLWRSIIETGNVIAKRTEPICVGIDNAPAALADPLKARIEANLAAFDIPTEKPGCKANSVIVFDQNAHRFVNWLDRQNAGIAFSALYFPEKRRLIKPVRPAYNWHVLKGATFKPFQGTGQPLTQQGASGGRNFQGAVFEPGGRILAGSLPADSQLTFSVIDTDTIDGITIEQLGDYLTMQMLVEFRSGLNDSVPPESILNLFNDKGGNPGAPPEMSKLDRAMLAQIYSGGQSFRPDAVRASIARRAVSDLDAAGQIIKEKQP